MSYSLIAPCGDCQNRFECADPQTLTDRLNQINEAPTFGDGVLSLGCGKYEPESPEVPQTPTVAQEELDRAWEETR